MAAEQKRTVVFDGEAMGTFLETATMIYAEVAPEVYDYLENLYGRLASDLATVNLAEVFQVLALFENGIWEDSQAASARVYRLLNRLGKDTTGVLGV